MRVAVVAEWYPSPADPVHGIWAHRQAQAAAAVGVEVRVLVLRRPVPPLSVLRALRGGDFEALPRWFAGTRRDLAGWELDGLSVTPVPWLGPPRPMSYGSWGYWMAPSLGRGLSRLWHEWRFDLVHAHNLVPTGHAAAFWARHSGIPLVLSAHGPDMTDVPFRSWIGRRATVDALRAADLVLANSSWARRRCVALEGGVVEVPIEVVHLGADVPSLSGAAVPAPAPAHAADPGRRLALVTVAHLQARKGHATVLHALAHLPAEKRPSYLVIGDGEEREGLESLARSLGVEVEFAGQLPHEQALARMGECDLFVMPGVDEPFGVAFVEAMAAGLAVIGSRGEGGPEDIAAAGEGMLLVEPGDVAGLLALIRHLDFDRAELARLGGAARQTAAAAFTWQRCGERTRAAYARVLAGAA